MSVELERQKRTKMARIRRRRRQALSSSCLLLLLLLSCFSSQAMASEPESLLDLLGETNMIHTSLHSPRIRSFGGRRGLQGNDKDNDKNNDKEDKDATEAPSVHPSETPSTAPTAIETSSPSTVPSLQMTTTISPQPTPSPTVSIVPNSVGNLVMEMSVADPTVTAADVNEGQANELLDGVLAGMLQVLCRMHYIMVLDNSVDGTRACPADDSQQRALQPQVTSSSQDGYPVVWTMSRIRVQDYENEEGDALMYWQVAFPVIDIGEAYTNWAIGQGASTSNEAEITSVALKGMHEDTYYATQKSIQRGYMDQQLPDTATAVADVDSSTPAPGAEQVDPDPFHPMRVAGMILLIVTLVSTFILVRCSARRKKERDLDSAIAKINKGGLVTEEGLDLMLDVGRKESEKAGMTQTEIEVVLQNERDDDGTDGSTTKENSSDSERMLPMPGYLGGGQQSSMHSSSPQRMMEPIENSKDEVAIEAAKDSAVDADKTYSFLSIFGSQDEDSEPEDAVLPHEGSFGEPIAQTISGIINMFSKSADSGDQHNDNGSQASAPHSRVSSPIPLANGGGSSSRVSSPVPSIGDGGSHVSAPSSPRVSTVGRQNGDNVKPSTSTNTRDTVNL